MSNDQFQFFLDEMAKAVPPKAGIRQMLIMDNASWHKASRLNWHHFELGSCRATRRDFNPLERLWLRLKADWFWDIIARTPQELSHRLSAALKSFIDNLAKTSSVYSPRK